MGKVVVKLGDIFEGGMDVTVLPCSAKGSISSSTERWKTIFGIDSPNDLCLNLSHGAISDPIPFPPPHKQTKHYMYAASVFNKESSYDIIRRIGVKIGEVAASNSTFVHLETPLLGAGAGQVAPEDSGRALCEGFLTTADDKSILFIFVNDNANYDAVSKAISAGFGDRLWDAVEVKPGFGGIAIDIKKLFKHSWTKASNCLKAAFRLRNGEK